MADEEEDLLVDDPVDPYEPETESALDEGAEEEPPAPLIDEDEDDAGVMDDVADGELADPPVEDDDAGEDLAPLPESWAELDPEAVDLPDADESEDTIADEVDALDDYDPLEITPDENEPEPEPVTWDAYEIQAREANSLGDFFQVALTDDPDATSVAITTLEPGATYDIRIRGVKADGSTSGWSDTETITLPVDQIPPPQPSAPVVVGVPGGFVVSHDGKTSTGGDQPTDYAQTVLWVQKGAGTPYIIDRFTGAFNITYNSLETDPLVWWVTTVDQAGNSSVKSADVNGQAQGLVDDVSIRDALDDAQAALDAAVADATDNLAALRAELADRPTIMRGPTPPTGDAAEGTLYFQVADGGVVAQYQHVDGAWVSQPVRSEAIASLGVHQLTASNVSADEAVIDKLWADGIAAHSATLARATVASPNLIPDMASIRDRMPAPFNGPLFGRNAEHPSIWLRGPASLPSTSVIADTRGDAASVISLEENTDYIFSGEDRGVAGSVYHVQLIKEDGAEASAVVDGVTSSFLIQSAVVAAGGAWTHRSAVFRVDRSGNYRLRFHAHHESGEQNSSGGQWWRNISIKSLMDGTLIADNSITAPKITASEDLTAKVAQFLTVKANHLDANEIWANSAWLGQAKFESEVSGNRVLIDSNGIRVGATSTPAGIDITRTGLTAKDSAGDTRLSMSATTGDLSLYGATITAGQLRTAEAGRRVTVDNNGITTYNQDGSVQSRLGSPQYSNSLAIRSPDGTLKEIGPHIYGSHSFSSYGTGTEASFNKGTATAYGSYTGATWSKQFQTVSNRYRVDLSFLLYGFVESSGRTATFDFWLVPTTPEGTILGGSFYRRELDLKNLIVEFPICYSTSLITNLPSSFSVGDTIRLRWMGRAKNFYTNPRMSYLSAHLTPA